MNLARISIYPVKSLKGVDLDHSDVTARGLRDDRRYMVVDSDSRLISQREFPRLASLRASISNKGILVAGEKNGTIEWCPAAVSQTEKRAVSVWDSTVGAVFAEKSVNDWFSAYLQTEAFLVYMPDDSIRPINPVFSKGDEIVSFADGYPLLLTNTASLTDLNSRLKTKIGMERFRPNVVVDSLEAFAEDRWKRLKIGVAVFRVTKPCARCKVTTIDQGSGESKGAEPLRTLASYRKAAHVYPDDFKSHGLGPNDVLFGVNLVPETSNAVIALDDSVEIIG